MRYLIACVVGCMCLVAVYTFHWFSEAHLRRALQSAGYESIPPDTMIKLPERMLLMLSVDRFLFHWRFALGAIAFGICLLLVRLFKDNRSWQ